MTHAPRPCITGVGNTQFGRLDGSDALGLMSAAAAAAVDDAGVARQEIDGLLCGYATTLPHLMLADLFAEHFGLAPAYAHAVQAGGASGAAMLMLAGDLVRSGRCRTVLVVAGENRLSGQSRDQSIQTLAQVGHPSEVRNGASVPSYYALMASRYCHLTGTTEADLAELAVLMRRHASTHPDAHLRELIDVHDVLASKPVSLPLKLLDCCPISDGAVAMIVSSAAGMNTGVCIAGAGQAHQHQHLTAMPNVLQTGAGISSRRALAEAGMTVGDIDLLAIYDSFTITLAMLLEEIGFADRGQAGACARAGAFGPAGPQPLNLHGGLLSFGHSGVAGGMVHVVEVVRQLRGTSFNQSISGSSRAFVHADGGVMSAHISIILERMS